MNDLSEIKKTVPLERLNQVIETDPLLYRFFLMRFNHYARASKTPKIRSCEIQEVVNRRRKSVISESRVLYERLKGIVKEYGISEELNIMMKDLESVFDIVEQREEFERGLDKDDFPKVMETKPKTSLEYFARAFFLTKHFPDKLQEIIDDYTRVLELSENFYTARANRCVWLGRLNGYDQGLVLESQKARFVVHNYSQSYSVEGGVEFKLRDYEQGVLLFGISISLMEAASTCESDHHLEELRKDCAIDYSNRAMCYHHLSQRDKTLIDLNAALKLNPEYVRVLNLRAMYFRDCGNYVRALDDYNSALRIRPEESKYLFWRGVVYKELEEYEKAISDFTQNILNLEPFRERTSYFHRGDCFLEKEMFERAILDYTKGKELGFWDSGERAKAVEKLKEKIMKM